jgi:transposase-like protein
MAEKKESVEATVRTIRRVTRKKYSAEEKVRIVLEGLRGETSIDALCRGKASQLTCITVGARISSKPASSAWLGTASARRIAGR